MTRTSGEWGFAFIPHLFSLLGASVNWIRWKLEDATCKRMLWEWKVENGTEETKNWLRFSLETFKMRAGISWLMDAFRSTGRVVQRRKAAKIWIFQTTNGTSSCGWTHVRFSVALIRQKVHRSPGHRWRPRNVFIMDAATAGLRHLTVGQLKSIRRAKRTAGYGRRSIGCCGWRRHTNPFRPE